MKFDILKDGEELCKDLRLNFDEVYSRTNTSYKPMQHLIQCDKDGKSWFEKEWFTLLIVTGKQIGRAHV